MLKLITALLFALAALPATTFADASPRATPAMTHPGASPTTAAATRDARDADAARYAAAERANPRAAEFAGGSTIVIAGSTAALVLVLVLLIILL